MLSFLGSLLIPLFIVRGTTAAAPATFRLGIMCPQYKNAMATPSFSVDVSGQRRMAAIRLAIEEVNDKTDGILDDLL